MPAINTRNPMCQAVYQGDSGIHPIPDRFHGLRVTFAGLPDRRCVRQRELAEQYQQWIAQLSKPSKEAA